MELVFEVKVTFPPDDQTDWEDLGLMPAVLEEMKSSLQRDVFGDAYGMEVRLVSKREEETVGEVER